MLLTLIFTILILILMPFTLTPISLGIWILTLALLTAIMLGVTLSSWFGFILLLLYVGGLLVMFAYFVAINPNNKIKLFDPLLFPALLFLMIIISQMKPKTLPTMSFADSMLNMFAILTAIELLAMLIVMGVTLLLILISVVKITKRELGSFRPHKPRRYA